MSKRKSMKSWRGWSKRKHKEKLGDALEQRIQEIVQEHPADDFLCTFREFVCKVRPSYRWYKHCEILCDVLQRAADGKIKRLMVFMPPRHGKSELCSRLFSAYFLYRYPQRWVAVTSYAADLAYTLSRAAQENYREAGGRSRAARVRSNTGKPAKAAASGRQAWAVPRPARAGI